MIFILFFVLIISFFFGIYFILRKRLQVTAFKNGELPQIIKTGMKKERKKEMLRKRGEIMSEMRQDLLSMGRFFPSAPAATREIKGAIEAATKESSTLEEGCPFFEADFSPHFFGEP